MHCAPGFCHRFFRRDSFGLAGLDFLHAPPDFLRPRPFDFRAGVIINALDDFFREARTRFGRQLQNLFFQSTNRHGLNKAEKRGIANENKLFGNQDELRKQSGNSGQLEDIFLSLTAGEK
jgi:hypothetical protein